MQAVYQRDLFASFIVVILLNLALLHSTVAAAAPAINGGLIIAQRASNSPAPSLAKEKAVRIAKKRHPGKVLSADQIKSKGPAVFRIKVLTKRGVVRTVHVDGHTGEVLTRQ